MLYLTIVGHTAGKSHKKSKKQGQKQEDWTYSRKSAEKSPKNRVRSRKFGHTAGKERNKSKKQSQEQEDWTYSGKRAEKVQKTESGAGRLDIQREKS